MRQMLRVPVLLALGATMVAVTLLVPGCASQAAPAPAPTQAPAAPAKAAEPAKAAAAPTAAPQPAQAAPAQPTAAPAPKVDFPQKGKSITAVSPWAAGGGNDLILRVLTPGMEKELGVSVSVVNKTGAAGQVGITEIAKSKPDGYTVGITTDIPAITTYLDPERSSAYGRKDLLQIAMVADVPLVIAVKADGPYKTLKDLVDAAKAKPEGVKMGTAGLMNDTHVVALLFDKVAGANFAYVHFAGSAESLIAVAGGHLDAGTMSIASATPQLKSGAARLLAVIGEKRDATYPDVPTAKELGYNVALSTSRGIIGPAGIPKDIVNILSASLKKTVADPEVRKKLDELAVPPVFLGPEEYAAYFDKVETLLKPIVKDIIEDRSKSGKK